MCVTYRTIVADPPWTPELGKTWVGSENGQRRGAPQAQYATMDLAAIKALAVPAEDQAHLYIWALSQHVDWAYEVARAWGFNPTVLFTWRKPGLGTGRFRCNTEHFLLARKGSRHGNPYGQGGRLQQASEGTCFDWPRGKHSEKPDAFYDLVERISPAPYVELFSRRSRLGWDYQWHDGDLVATNDR
jgi:N6-adenosine-specific RNA methylase IME4